VRVSRSLGVFRSFWLLKPVSFFFAILAFFCGYSGFIAGIDLAFFLQVDTERLKAMLEILSPAG
jgi:hypothetical protein